MVRPAPPCPPGADCGGGGDVVKDFNRIDKDGDGMLSYNELAFDAADSNKDGKLSFDEYYDARASGNLSNTSGFGNIPISTGNMSSTAALDQQPVETPAPYGECTTCQ